MIKFKVNNHEWCIQFIDHENREFMDTACGFAEYIHNIIYINDSMNDHQILSTLKHELAHAFRWSYGLATDVEPAKITNAEIEEAIANFTESFSEQVVKLSYDLFEKIKKEKNGGASKESKRRIRKAE